MSTYGWANISGIDDGSGGTPGGIDGSVQFNDNGINFAGVSDFTYNDATKTLNVVNVAASSVVAPSISAAGLNNDVQYKKAGILTGDGGFQFDDSIQTAIISNINTFNITPGTITDSLFQTGNPGQVLSSTGPSSNNLEWVDGTVPGGSNSMIQFNDFGSFGGNAGLIYDKFLNRTIAFDLTAQTLRPTTIIDGVGSPGVMNQVLTSTGSSIEYQNQVSPGGSGALGNQNIQYNNLGTFTGSGSLIFDPAGASGAGRLRTNGIAAFGTGNVTVPRLFAGSGGALFTGSLAWNDNWSVVGDTGIASGSGVGLGWNSTSNYGALLSLSPGAAFRPMYYTASNHIFGTTDGTERMRILDNGRVGIGTNNPETQLEVRGANAEIQVVSTSGSAVLAISNNEPPGQRKELILTYNPTTNRSEITSVDQGDFFTTISMQCSGLKISNTGFGNAAEQLDVDNNIRASGNISCNRIITNRFRDGTLSDGVAGQVIAATGSGWAWTDAPKVFFDSNATFSGTTGHRIFVSATQKGPLTMVTVSMQRDGGIHFDLINPPLTVGTQTIAILPVGYRPPASVDGIGYASNNNVWATQAFNWGSLNIDTSGNIRMRSPASGGPITTIQPNLEQITCNIYFLSTGTLYNSDGITR
jgi:hypothetical protein